MVNVPATHTEYCNGSCSYPSRDFAFAFDNIEFSDKILDIEIVDTRNFQNHRRGRSASKRKLNDKSSDGQICDTPTPQSTRNPQNRRGRSAKKQKQNGDEAANSMDCSTVVRTKTLHISSPILAAASPFFYKLFSNGMMESKQRHVTLRISAFEEAALMELLNFVYSNTLSTTSTPPEMLDILMIADKFEVASCMKYCSCLLWNMPMKPEYALLYLELSSSVLTAKVVQPLKDKAMRYLADQYKDITMFQDEVLTLSLAGIEAVFSSDDLQVPTEDDVYDILLNWAKSHYPKLKNRQDIIGTRLIHLIRFPYMTFSKLKSVLQCDDLNHQLSSKAVLEALLFKSGAMHQQNTFIAEVPASTSHRYVERDYKWRPVKVVEFDSPSKQCVVYLDLKREELANLFPSGSVFSQNFHLGGQVFYLWVECSMDEQSSFHTMGLYLAVNEMGRGSGSCEISYKFAARTKPTNEYVIECKDDCIFTCRESSFGSQNVFDTPWADFIAKESLYLIDDILHLRAEVTFKS